MCFLVSSIPALTFLTSIVCFLSWGQKKKYRVVLRARCTENESLNDLHDLILQINYDLEYSSDFSIKCIPSWSSLIRLHIHIRVIIITSPRFLSIIPFPQSRHISRIHNTTATCHWKEKNRGPPSNHPTLVHDTFGECSCFCLLFCFFSCFLSLRFWLYANSNEITWRMQHFALWFRSIGFHRLLAVFVHIMTRSTWKSQTVETNQHPIRN